jgi:hypothetical protein
VAHFRIQAEAADEFASRLLPLFHAIRGTGATTLDQISSALNNRGVRAARGGRWHVSSVMNLLVRAQQTAHLRALL